MNASVGAPGAGRPPVTSRGELTIVALELFLRQGFEETSVDEIAAAAGVSRRTFFRYFPTKSAVLWSEFDEEIELLRAQLAAADPETPLLRAIHHAVVEINRAGLVDARELRARMTLINQVPSLQGAALVHYSGWTRVISDFVAARTGVPEQSLFPITIGRTVLATALAAFDVWADRDDRSLVAYLDEALGALAEGFDQAALRERVVRSPFTTRRPRRRRATPDIRGS